MVSPLHAERLQTQFCTTMFSQASSVAASGLSPCLDGDIVVVGGEVATRDPDILAGIGVAPVVVLRAGRHRYFLNRHVGAKGRVHGPERGTLKMYALHQDVVALVKLEHRGAKIMAVTEHALFQRHASLSHLLQQQPIRLLLLHPKVPDRVSLPVEHPRASDRDIGLLVGMDQRRVVITAHTLPSHQLHGKIIHGIGTEHNRSARFRVEIHVALQSDGPVAEPLSGRNHYAASARIVAGVNGRGKRRR